MAYVEDCLLLGRDAVSHDRCVHPVRCGVAVSRTEQTHRCDILKYHKVAN
jgi:hypothetical protein